MNNYIEIENRYITLACCFFRIVAIQIKDYNILTKKLSITPIKGNNFAIKCTVQRVPDVYGLNMFHFLVQEVLYI